MNNSPSPLAALCALLIGFSSPAALARTLTFDQVMQAAQAGHPALLGKRAAQDAAQAERQGAEWQRYPTPSIEATAQSGGNAGLVRIEQPLWAGGRIDANIDAAGSRFDAAGAAVDEARLDLSLKVIAAYSEALRQTARGEHALAGVKEHQKLLEMIRRRVGQEVSSAADLRLAESRWYQAANDLLLATQARDNALAQLAQLSGQPVTGVTALTDGGAGTDAGRAAAALPTHIDAALTQALAWSPALRRLTHEFDAAHAEIAAKRSAWWPQLALRLEKSVGQSATLPGNDSRAMLVLSAQPGAGLSAGANVEAAVARREAVRMTKEAVRRDTTERVTLDWNEWAAARSRLMNAQQSRAMSTEVFESYTRQYVIGRKTWVDVLNAVREAVQAELALEDARAQVLASRLRLLAQTGALHPTEAVQP